MHQVLSKNIDGAMILMDEDGLTPTELNTAVSIKRRITLCNNYCPTGTAGTSTEKRKERRSHNIHRSNGPWSYIQRYKSVAKHHRTFKRTRKN